MMITYHIHKALFLRAVAAIDVHPAGASLPNGDVVRRLLNELEMCSIENEQQLAEVALARQREEWRTQDAAAAGDAALAQPGQTPTPAIPTLTDVVDPDVPD